MSYASQDRHAHVAFPIGGDGVWRKQGSPSRQLTQKLSVVAEGVWCRIWVVLGSQVVIQVEL